MKMAGTDIIRVFLFAVRLVLWISAVITMGLTAWTVTHLKGYRTIFTLVIVSPRMFSVLLLILDEPDTDFPGQAVLTTAFYIPSLFTACMHRNVGYIIPLDIVFYALYARSAPSHSPATGSDFSPFPILADVP